MVPDFSSIGHVFSFLIYIVSSLGYLISIPLFILSILSKLLYTLFKTSRFVDKNTILFRKNSTLILAIILFLFSFFLAFLKVLTSNLIGKPVIYLYPKQEERVVVKLSLNEKFVFTYK